MEGRESEAAEAVLLGLSRVEVADGQGDERLAVFPMFPGPEGGLTGKFPPPDYITLAEAIALGGFSVMENPMATVPELLVRNSGAQTVLILDGEEVVGGKQNRIVNVTVLVGAVSELKLPVTCVEHGRWRDVSSEFQAGEFMMPTLRQAKSEQVRMNLAYRASPSADQGAIWDELASRHNRAESESATGAMDDLYRMRESRLRSYGERLTYPEGAIGFVAAVGGGIAGAELFDQPRTAEKLWARLVRSYAMDAADAEAGPPVARERAVKLLGRMKNATHRTFPGVGLGEDVRLEGDGAAGAALVFSGVPVHVSLYRQHRRRHGGVDSRIARASARRWLRGTGGHSDS